MSDSRSNRLLPQVYVDEGLGEIGFASVAGRGHAEAGEGGTTGATSSQEEGGGNGAGESVEGDGDAEAEMETYGCDPRSSWSPWR